MDLVDAVVGAAISATAWTTLPIVLYSFGPPSWAPTAEASSQRSPHVVNASTWDGEIVMGSSSANAGPSSDSAVMAYQFSGFAPRTPARARRARWAAAARRSGSGRDGSATAERRSATSADRDSHRVFSSSCDCSIAPGSSSFRNRDGRSSVSSPPTAVTTRRLRARVTAT